MKRISFFWFLSCFFPLQIVAQNHFIEMIREALSYPALGKSCRYEWDGDKDVCDSMHKTIEVNVGDFFNKNEDVIKRINGCPNFKFLNISENFFSKDTISYGIGNFHKLNNITYLSIHGGKFVRDYNQFFDEINNMPELKYLLINYLNNKIDLSKNSFFQHILNKLDGLQITGNAVILPTTHNSLSSLYLSQSTFIIERNLKNVYNNGLKNIYIYTDSLTAEIIEQIEKFKNLEYIGIQATYISPDVSVINSLKKLRNLKALEIGGYKLYLSQHDFEQLPTLKQLKKLYIWNLSPAQAANCNPIFGIPQLEDLAFALDADIHSLEWTETKSTSLKSLKIYGKLKTISSALGDLKNLETLTLNYHALESLPPSIGNLTHLKTINVGNNNLADLPESFNNLSSLQTLNLSGNHLTKLPELGNFKDLEKLFAEDNDIAFIPASIGNCTKMKEINLQANFIAEMPSEIYNLKNLVTLFLSTNNISRIPDGIEKLENLQYLYIDNLHENSRKYDKQTNKIPRLSNNITYVPAEIKELKNLKILDFSKNNKLGNNILQLFFESKSKDYNLDLNECGIDKLPENGWAKLSIKSLDLSGNKISKLPDDFFNNRIGYVNLSCNPLGNYAHSVSNRTNLMILAYLEKKISKEELLQQENLLEEIMKVGNVCYLGRNVKPLLELYPIAFEIDSAKTFQKMDHDSYADALFEAERYAACIPYYTYDINKQINSHMIWINSFVPNLLNRSEAYLQIGDTISAMRDLDMVTEHGYNKDENVAMLYLAMGDKQNYYKRLSSKADYYLKHEDINKPLYQLSLLEIYTIADDKIKFKEYAQTVSIDKQKDAMAYFIFEYLKILNNWGNKNIDKEIDNFVKEAQSQKYQNTNWDCHLVEKWAKYKPQEQRKRIERLNSIICPH